MQSVKASDAKNKFGQLLDMAQAEPVSIQKNGRDVAVILSPDEFKRLQVGAGGVSPAVAKLHARSVERWGTVYDALAK